jgi:hypothetical protein
MESEKEKIFSLNEDSELRLEIGAEECIVELLKGVAEVFGTPLAKNKRYTLPPGLTWKYKINI